MKITAEQMADGTLLRVETSRIDASGAILFKDTVREAALDGSGRVVLDLGQVEFVDSSGLGAIVAAMKLMPEGRQFELANLTPPVNKLFRMTRMDSIFTIHPTLEESGATPT